MVNNYKDLIFWQKSYNVTISVVKLCRKIPSDKVSFALIDQILRSSASVGANIAEGFGRYKGKEYKRFLQISLGSANETEHWLLVMKDVYPKFEVEIKEIMSENLEVIKMIASSLKKLNV